MALRIEYETHYGITCDYAHCIVKDARVTKEEHRSFEENDEGEQVETSTYTFEVSYGGKIFASEDAYDEGASPIGGFNGQFDLDNGAAKTQYNLIKQSYLDLKTKDGFTDGTDC